MRLKRGYQLFILAIAIMTQKDIMGHRLPGIIPGQDHRLPGIIPGHDHRLHRHNFGSTE